MPGGPIKVYLRGMMHDMVILSNDNLRSEGGNKQGALTIGNYIRLYTGFSGMTANGMEYGAFLELRQQYYSGMGSGGSHYASNVPYVRRQQGYLKGDWGQVRFGEADAPTGLFMTGTFENFVAGGNATWNADGFAVSDVNASIVPDWPFPEDSGYYTTGKVVYLSPQFAGFDFGFSYEPNDSNTAAGSPVGNILSPGFCTTAAAGAAGCTNMTTITAGSQYRRNTVDAVGRYQGMIGPIAVTGTIGVMTAGHVINLATRASNPTIVDTGWTFAYKGFAVGGNVIGGNTGVSGGGLVPLIQGAPHELGYIVGTSYAFGPFIVGASFLSVNSAGAYNGTTVKRALQSRGVLVGGTYNWGPGAQLYASYLYGQRHQSGYNFVTGAAGASNNNTRAMGVMIGNVFSW
jgi:hypothetical protein